MKWFILTLFLSLFVSFTPLVQPNAGKWKAIEVGDYILDFPSGFTLTPIKGIDSDIGEINSDSVHFRFDFGHYSPSFGQTPQEYLKRGFWKMDAGIHLMKRWRRYNDSNWPKVEVLSVRQAIKEDSVLGSGCDYVARCKHKNRQFDYAIFLPDEVKNYNFVIDSTDRFYMKIVLAKDSQKGATGLYIRRIKPNEAVNSYLALSVFATNLTKSQQELVVKIYKTARLNPTK